jgi:hypothetical protein
MKNSTKDIPVELDMKILEYASKKKFKSEKSHYFAVLRFAALVAFVVGVCFAFDNFYRSKRQQLVEYASIEHEYEQIYAEITMLSDELQSNYDFLAEQINNEWQEPFSIAYVEQAF